MGTRLAPNPDDIAANELARKQPVDPAAFANFLVAVVREQLTAVVTRRREMGRPLSLRDHQLMNASAWVAELLDAPIDEIAARIHRGLERGLEAERESA